MRIDSSGNLLVGKTSNTISAAGAKLGTGGSNFTRDNSEVVYVNRTTSDGSLITLAKDGSTVGSIGTQGGDLNIGTAACGIAFVDGVPAVYPWTTSGNATRDAAIDLGDSGGRFKDLYLSGGAYLGGTGSANHLDDYEEGTWTAELKGSTASATTPVTRTGTYTKVGNLVHVQVGFINVNTTGASGSVQITGLPFTNTSANTSSATIGLYTGLAHTANNNPIMYINASATLIQGGQISDSAVSSNWFITATTGVYFYVSATYTI